ncbi:MAG: CIA30 family protein [Pseudomonadota bacterium]
MLARRSFMALMVSAGPIIASKGAAAKTQMIILDDFSDPKAVAKNGKSWRYVADTVMGGISKGQMEKAVLDGRPALHLTGAVRLESNGGFVQMALDISTTNILRQGEEIVAIELDTLGNNEDYNVHLRTSDLNRPWQSYRQSFVAAPQWTTQTFNISDFAAYRTEAPLDIRKLRSLGIVAIGRKFEADIAISGLRLITRL